MKTNLTSYHSQLYRSHYFDGIPEGSLSDVLDYLHARVRKYQKGDSILNIGDPFHHAGVILEGTIEGSFQNENYDTINMNQFHEGETFGESMACAEIKTSPMHIRAVTDCVLLFLDFTVLYDLKHPHAYQLVLTTNLLHIFSRKNVFLNQKVRILGQKGLRDRILVYLRSQQKDRSGIVHVPFSQTAMAEFLGVNRSALSRELGRMMDDGTLSCDGRTYHLL